MKIMFTLMDVILCVLNLLVLHLVMCYDIGKMEIICTLHKCSLCNVNIEACVANCPSLGNGLPLICPDCMNGESDDNSDEESEEDDKGFMTMEDFMRKFEKGLERTFRQMGMDTIGLFAKINDAVKLAEFMRSKNTKRMQKFQEDYKVPHADDTSCKMLYDQAIIDIAEMWYKKEMLEWTDAEKKVFLEYVVKCKEFMKVQKVLYTKETTKSTEGRKKRRTGEIMEDKIEEQPYNVALQGMCDQ
jgi:hypothetical protein